MLLVAGRLVSYPSENHSQAVRGELSPWKGPSLAKCEGNPM